MGQIIDRIIRIARAYVNDSRTEPEWAEHMLESDDDELRRIIDELGSGSPPPYISPDVREAFEVFGVDPSATDLEVKATYRRLMHQWHPDKFVNASVEERAAAQRRAAEINAAYVILKSFFARR